MPRNVYDVVNLVGNEIQKYSSKASSICLTSGGQKLYVGTVDGSIITFDCVNDTTNAIRADSFECFVRDETRHIKDKKSITKLEIIESWQLMLSFVDASLWTVNLGQNTDPRQLNEVKGIKIKCFCVEESEKLLYLSTRKTLHVFSWEGASFAHQKDLPLSNTAHSMATVPGVPTLLILGAKRGYSLFNVGTRQLTTVLEMEKDQSRRLLTLGLPRSSARGARALIAKEAWGVLVDIESKMQKETLAWSAPPLQARLALPFLIALLPSQVEVHDVATLGLVQTLDISGATCMTGIKLGKRGGETTLVGSEQGIHALKMVPIENQVETLVESGAYEEALSLCAICEDKQFLGGIDVQTIHERYAYELFSWGDYEAAIGHFLSAETSVACVVFLFPSFVPPELPTTGLERPPRDKAGKARPLSGASLNRAAVALFRFLEDRRQAIASLADQLEHQRLAEGDDAPPSSMPTSLRGAGRGMDALGLEGPLEDVDKAVMLATMVDTVLVTVGCQCNPPRTESLVNLLGHPEGNRCLLDACAPILAACGLPTLELLLWLYRSKGEHARALALLTEDQCVRPASAQGAIGWSQDKFQQWLASYLRALWFSKDIQFPPLVLEHVRPLMQSNPPLGLTVFTKMGEETETSLGEAARKGGRKALRRYPKRAGGIGLPPQDVVNFLKSIEIAPETAAKVVAAPREPGSEELPLTSGRALAITYLEHLVEINAASPLLHDELAYLLMEGLLAHEGDPISSTLESIDQYRKKLQAFLQVSRSYHPARLLSVMPSHFLHEHALLLSRLGRHEEVLSIYVHQLNDTQIADAYCSRIWEQAQAGQKNNAKEEEISRGAQDDKDVYLSLLKVFLSDDALGESNTRLRALSLLEQHFDRMDTAKALEMLPSTMPLLHLQPFLAKVVRHATARKRTHQIVHQLHRVDYLNVKYELIQLQSRMSRVPELALSFAHLGRVTRSLPPQELTEEGAEYIVTCTKHLFESAHVVLQFNITNTLPTHRLHEITVHVEASDPDLYTVKSDRALPALSYQSTGSCYVVLARAPGLGVVPASFSCEMKFHVLRVNPTTGLPEKDNTTGFLEEYPLEDIELTAGDFSMAP